MPDHCMTITLGLPEVRVIRQEETMEAITVEVMYRAHSLPCPRCGQRTPKVHSVRGLRKRDRRLWDKRVLLMFQKRRFHCLSCGKVFTEPDLCGVLDGAAGGVFGNTLGEKPSSSRCAG